MGFLHHTAQITRQPKSSQYTHWRLVTLATDHSHPFVSCFFRRRRRSRRRSCFDRRWLLLLLRPAAGFFSAFDESSFHGRGGVVAAAAVGRQAAVSSICKRPSSKCGCGATSNFDWGAASWRPCPNQSRQASSFLSRLNALLICYCCC